MYILKVKTIVQTLMVVILLAVIIFSGVPTPLYAEESSLYSGFDDDDEGEFDEEESFYEAKAPAVSEKESNDYFKDFKFTASHLYSYGTKKPDTGSINNQSALRCEFDKSFLDSFFIKFDGKVSGHFEDDHVAEAEDKKFKTEGKIREFYLQAAFDQFMIRGGRQIIVWGETDGGVINDVVSPRDRSEFIFIDLEDSRLGQYIASVDVYSDVGDFLFFVTGKPFLDEMPESGTRYDRPIAGINIIDDKTTFSEREFGFKWKRIIDKFELSLMGASLFHNEGVLDYYQGNDYHKTYSEYWFSGVGFSYTKGAYLLKIDASYKNNYPLQGIDVNSRYIESETDISDTALGIEYDANGKYLLNFELTNRHVFHYQGNLPGMKQDNPAFYFLFSKQFINDTLEVEYVFFHQFHERNSFHKTELDYSIIDDLDVSIAYTVFQIEDVESALWEYRNEDRVEAELNYYF